MILLLILVLFGALTFIALIGGRRYPVIHEHPGVTQMRRSLHSQKQVRDLRRRYSRK